MTFNQNFILRTQGPSTTIFLRLTVEGKRTEFSLQRKCDPTQWSSEKGRVKGRNECSRSINAYLDAVELRIYEIFQNFVVSGNDFDGEKIKARYLGTDAEKTKTLLEVFDHHNIDFEKLVVKGMMSFRTLQKFRTVKGDLAEYLKYQYRLYDIELSRIDYQFVKGFELYLKTVKSCAHSSSMQYMKKLKKIISQCVHSGWILRNPFVGLKISEGESARTFLTEEELQRVASSNFTIKRLSLVRDIFLFSCYTGIAFCDISKLSEKNIIRGVDGGRWIVTTRSKTKTESRIPVLPPVAKLLEKYKTHSEISGSKYLLPVLSNQKMNSYLKEIADLCGIAKTLTFHCARHTFATTVTLTNGVPIESVSKMLGHKSIKTTQIYAKVVDEKIIKDMEVLKSKFQNGEVAASQRSTS